MRPVGEIVAQRERADRRAGDAVAAFAVLGVGDAASSDRLSVSSLRREYRPRTTRRAERADAIAAIDLLVDAEQHRAQHPVGDHLVEALVAEIADRSAAGAGTGRPGRGRSD